MIQAMLRLPEIRVNLVEEKGWKPYDPGGDISEWASDNAYEELRSMSASDLADLLDNIVTKAPQARKRWGPREELEHESLEAVAEAVKAAEPELDTVRQIILDTLTWAWEEAYMPDDGDIEGAMDDAAESLLDDFSIVSAVSAGSADLWDAFMEEESGPKIPETKRWGPRLDDEAVLRDLLSRVRYERKPKHYDRYLVFTWKGSSVIEALERFAIARKLGGRKGAKDALEDLLGSFANEYLAAFWKALSRRMEHVDVGNRADFWKHWRGMLADPDVSLATASREIERYARGAETT